MRSTHRQVKKQGGAVNAPIVLFGGTDATLVVADAALETGVSIAAVVTVGESYRISYSADPVSSSRCANVAEWCAKHGIQAITFDGYEEALSRIEDRDFALGVIAGWYHMVPKNVRTHFRLGCVGFHASLLPKLRGGAPLNWAILERLHETGVTMFELGDGMDDGPVYARQRFKIGADANVGELVTLANGASAALVRRYLPQILAHRLKPRPQSGRASYGLQRRPEDGLIDWTKPAVDIHRLVRAVTRPYPGAYSHLDGEAIYIWQTRLPKAAPRVLGAHGQIARLPGVEVPCVITGNGILAIMEATFAAGSSAIDRLAKSSQKRFGT